MKLFFNKTILKLDRFAINGQIKPFYLNLTTIWADMDRPTNRSYQRDKLGIGLKNWQSVTI